MEPVPGSLQLQTVPANSICRSMVQANHTVEQGETTTRPIPTAVTSLLDKPVIRSSTSLQQCGKARLPTLPWWLHRVLVGPELYHVCKFISPHVRFSPYPPNEAQSSFSWICMAAWSQILSTATNNDSGHFYRAVSHRHGWAHRALQDQDQEDKHVLNTEYRIFTVCE